MLKNYFFKTICTEILQKNSKNAKTIFSFINFFFRIISKQFSFQKNLVSEPLGIIIFKQISEDFLFKTFQKQFQNFLIIFPKKICLKKCIQKYFRKMLLSENCFSLGQPVLAYFWHKFGSKMSVQKCFSKNSEKSFFKTISKIFSKSFQKNS